MSTCPELPALLRLRDEGAMDEVDRHLAECPSCAAAWADLADLTALGRSLPDGQPDDARRESVRTAILAQAAAPERRGPVPRWAAAAAILAAVLAGGTLLRPAEPESVARISSVHGAVYSVSRSLGDEVVELIEGEISVVVDRLGPGERFRIVTENAEVEVRGTAFTVRAEAGVLVGVEVREGVVEVRHGATSPVRLAEGARWRPTPAAQAAATPAPPAQSPAPASPPPQTPPSPPPQPKLAPEAADPARPAAQPPTPAPAVRAPAAADARPRAATRATPRAIRRAERTQRPDRSARTTGSARTPTPPPAPVSTPPPVARPQTARFDAGWAALRGGRHAEAARAFGDAARLDGPLREDAGWWEVVALGRAGDDRAARRAARRFLQRHPDSPRRAEASVVLGWLELEAGEIDAAERAFRSGASARRPAVREKARLGLEAVDQWRRSAR